MKKVKQDQPVNGAAPKLTIKGLNQAIKQATASFNAASETTAKAVEANENLKRSIVEMKKIRNRVIIEYGFTIIASLVVIYACLHGAYVLAFVGFISALKYVVTFGLSILFIAGIGYFVKRLIELFKR